MVFLSTSREIGKDFKIGYYHCFPHPSQNVTHDPLIPHYIAYAAGKEQINKLGNKQSVHSSP
jgi:hypothetical protein